MTRTSDTEDLQTDAALFNPFEFAATSASVSSRVIYLHDLTVSRAGRDNRTAYTATVFYLVCQIV